MSNELLKISNLKTHFLTDSGEVRAVDGVDLVVHENETLGMVGESGCGKSVTSLSVMRLIDKPGKIVEGEIEFHGNDLLKMSNIEMRKIRGNEISMIFQEPMTSLNPVHSIGSQITEALKLHQNMNKRDALHKAVEMLKLVGIPSPEIRVHEFPHQLSGGMRQRAMIAMALSCNPKLLIADEPTTALDVTIQAQILDLMRNMKDETGSAVLIITHDLGVIAEMADNVVVLYAGKVVEYADVKRIFGNPYHPYTIELQESIPRLTDDRGRKLHPVEGSIPDPLDLPDGCKFHPRCRFARDICSTQEPPLISLDNNRQSRCWMYDPEKASLFDKESDSIRVSDEPTAASVQTLAEEFGGVKPLLKVENLVKHFPVRGGMFRTTIGHVRAVDDVSFDIRPGETFGLVGESGCGKTTTGRLVLRLLNATSGNVFFDDRPLYDLKKRELRPLRRDLQIIFQDPFASLNPRMTVGDIIGESLSIHRMNGGQDRQEKVAELLSVVGLESEHMRRYPHQFSGGQRQRIGIARAIALDPRLIVCDEPVSALDVSIQAQIINLLEDLQERLKLSYLFIAHDLSVVKHISDRVAVMYLGKIVELAVTDDLFNNPVHPYTDALLAAVPVPDPQFNRNRNIIRGDVPSPSNPPPGCRFHTRCPYAEDICKSTEPPLEAKRDGHMAACHLR
ncbi:MAG: ABC transporter ATP-binding protein [Spirochaetales bacterium]|nr:ABC transporter ATP-binding protein [Spirochaetales bacterium]